jgi:hypothetical protein
MPDVFEEFRTKRFNLVWQGSRDGVTVTKSHRRCEACVNTLTLLSDTDWKVFGDFTRVEWKSDHCLGALSLALSFCAQLSLLHSLPSAVVRPPPYVTFEYDQRIIAVCIQEARIHPDE